MVAGVSYTYRHYSTRDELIAAIFEQSILETDQAVMSSINERMTAFEQLDAMLRAVIPLAIAILFGNQSSLPLKSCIRVSKRIELRPIWSIN